MVGSLLKLAGRRFENLNLRKTKKINPELISSQNLTKDPKFFYGFVHMGMTVDGLHFISFS